MMAMNNVYYWDIPQPSGLGDLQEQNLTIEAMESQMPTGYLQDVLLAGWSSAGDGGRSKRRRLSCAAFPSHNSANLVQDFWNSDFSGSTSADSGQQENFLISDHDPFDLFFANSETPTPAALDQSRSDSKVSLATFMSRDLASKDCDEEKRLKLKKDKKKKKVMGLVYPFTVVKSGGLEGDATLADINARILMRPRRPVRHPVGEYAGRPCVADGGVGLSGKAVVSLARIHTVGRGTITIIRTRG